MKSVHSQRLFLSSSHSTDIELDKMIHLVLIVGVAISCYPGRASDGTSNVKNITISRVMMTASEINQLRV